MEPILKSILENKTENYLLPFFWQHDGHDAEIPARVQRERLPRILCGIAPV